MSRAACETLRSQYFDFSKATCQPCQSKQPYQPRRTVAVWLLGGEGACHHVPSRSNVRLNYTTSRRDRTHPRKRCVHPQKDFNVQDKRDFIGVTGFFPGLSFDIWALPGHYQLPTTTAWSRLPKWPSNWLCGTVGRAHLFDVRLICDIHIIYIYMYINMCIYI